MGVNKVILVGNVGNDPEVTYVQEDVPVAKFSLATSESYKNKSGERVTNTEWHNIVIWRGLAKVVEQYVKKGSKLYLEGKLTHRKYEKDGVTKYFTEVVAKDMQMLDSKGQSTEGGGSYQNSQNSAPANNQTNTTSNTAESTPAFDSGEIDDLPF